MLRHCGFFLLQYVFSIKTPKYLKIIQQTSIIELSYYNKEETTVKKALSLLLAVMMLVSMMTCVVLPVAAASEPVSYAASLVNLFTKKASLEGVVDQGTGAFKANDKFYSSESISVKEGDVLMFGPARTTQGYQVVSFKGDTVDKTLEVNSANIANYTAFTLTDDATGNMVFCKYTIPAGVTAVKLTCEVVTSNSFLVTKNQEFTLQNWKDYVAAKYPHTDLVNLYGAPALGRWSGSGLKTSNEYYAPSLKVAKNDVIYYGPADPGQGYQLAFYTAAEMTSGAEVKSANNDGYDTANGTLKVVDTFDNGQVIYAYRAKAAGYVGIATPVAYNSFAMITKNQPLTTQNFHNYWDSKPDANLYNIKLDVQAGYYDIDGLRKDTTNHNGSHSVAVKPGDVLLMGPCWDKTTSFQGVTFDINRNPVSKIYQTDSIVVQKGTSGNDGTNPGMILQYTVPEGVYYIRFINRTVFNSAYTIQRVTPLKDSDNLYEREKYPMGLWKADATTAPFQNEYYASAQYTVKAGETVYFGPAQYAQGYQVVFNSADGKVSATVANGTAGNYTNPAGSLNVYDTFDNTAHVIYAYRATQDGTIAFPVRSEYHEKFLVTRTPFSVRQFHAYWDAKAGVNCYDPVLDYIGLVMNGDGTTKAAQHNSAHELAVTPGEVISFGPVQVSQGYDLITRNALNVPHKQTVKATRGEAIAKTDLTYLPATGSGEPSDYAIYSYTVPENVYSINIVNRIWTNDFFMIKRGTMTATEYYDAIGIEPDSPLKGKTGLFVGDSISAAANDARYMKNKGLGAWAGRIGWHYQLEDTNKSVSGSTIAINTGRGYIADQLTSMAANDYDYVIIQGGVNDANVGVAEGAVSTSYNIEDFDRNTYAGGLEYIFAKAVELYGDTAAIGYIINYQLPNRSTFNRFGSFVDTAKAACEKWGVAYIDLYNNDAITTAMDLKTNGSLYAQDNLHPNERGYEVLYPVIGDWMGTLSTHEGMDWKTIADEAETAAKALDLTLYTTESAAAFTAAMGALPEGDEARYLAVLDAVDLLDWTAPLPVSGYTALNVVTQRIYGRAAEFSVSSAEDLQTLHKLTTDGTLKAGATVKQLKEIDLSANADLMIGTEATPFTATYDGQGYVIKGFTLAGAKNTAAFIPFLAGTLKNVTFTDAVTSVNGWTAVAVSNAMAGAVIENVHVKNATITKTGDNNGLSVLVCQGKGAFTVKDCTVTDCKITITTDRQTYGNVGAILSSDKGNAVSITNCYAVNNTFTLNVNDTAKHIGGLVGEIMSTGTVIKNCGAVGTTFTKDYASIAGVAGIVTVAATVENCYTDHATVLISTAATPVNCYAAVPMADIASGKLAYTLKTTSGDVWVQGAYPTLNAGQAVTKIDYLVQENVFFTAYTDAEGKQIGTCDTPVVEGYLFDGWTSDTAENGDVTRTAKLVLLGDVDNDGVANVSDVTVLMQSLVGLETECSIAADANGDGRVSIYDAVVLLRALSA